MLSSEVEQWLTAVVRISEPLERALDLGGRNGIAQRVTVLDGLATRLGLEVDRLGEAGYDVLDALLEPLQAAMALGPGSWITDVEDSRHRTIVDAALVGIGLEAVLAALAQFGWSRQRLDLSNPQVAEIEPAVRAVFERKLAQRLFSALEQWRKANVRPAPNPRWHERRGA